MFRSNGRRKNKDLKSNHILTKQRDQQIQFTTTQTIYSAPIPPVDVVEGWERVCPGSANRILKQFEQQSTHRQALESRNLGYANVKEILGQVLAFIIFMSGIGGGIYLVAIGKDAAGLISVIGSLIIPSALFLLGRKGGIRELLAKRKLAESLVNQGSDHSTE